MKPWNLIGYAVVGLLALAGMFGVNRCTDSGNAAEIARWKLKKASADSVVHVRDSALAEANARNAASVPIYIAGRDRIIREVAGTSAEKPVAACFDISDSRISACEAAKTAAAETITALRNDLKVSEAKPEPKEKRFQLYGAAGYSVRVDSTGTQMAPAFRAGIDSKLIGPVRLMTDGQLSLPGKGRAQSLWQLNVFGRVNF